MSKKSIKKKKIHKDCWSLDTAFYTWLRERLPVYLHDTKGFVDLTYHVMEYNGIKINQQEAIERMIYLLKQMEGKDEWDDDFADLRKELTDLWGLWLPAMWW